MARHSAPEPDVPVRIAFTEGLGCSVRRPGRHAAPIDGRIPAASTVERISAASTAETVSAAPTEPVRPAIATSSRAVVLERVEPSPPLNVGDEDVGTAAQPSDLERRSDHGLLGRVTWLVCVVLLSVVVAIGVRTFVVQSFWIPSASMEPTLHGCPGCNDDRVLVDKLSYRLHAIHRGDVVVFHRPPTVATADQYLIKRVIALPGETVSASDRHVVVNGRALTEPYVNAACQGTEDFAAVVVPAGRVFVMGDNRCESLDGRVFGPIAESSVIGRAFVKIWPVQRIDWL